MNLVIFLLCCYGVCFGIRSSKLLDRPRNYLLRRSLFVAELLSCSFCTGFHAGWLSWLLLLPLTHLSPLAALPAAFAGAAWCYLADTVMLKLEKP